MACLWRSIVLKVTGDSVFINNNPNVWIAFTPCGVADSYFTIMSRCLAYTKQEQIADHNCNNDTPNDQLIHCTILGDLAKIQVPIFTTGYTRWLTDFCGLNANRPSSVTTRPVQEVRHDQERYKQ